MRRIIISILLSFILFGVSCKKNEDLPTSSDVHERLYDKMWRCDDANFQADHFFSSDGTFVISPSTGTYQWRPNDTLILTDPTNSTTTVLWFTSLEDSTMAYWPTWEPEGIIYKFTIKK